MKRVILILLAASCGRDSAGLNDYRHPVGPTSLSGTLRTPDDSAPAHGRVFIRSGTQTIAVIDADAEGHFEAKLTAPAGLAYVALDDDGNAARGQWALQLNGSNDVGRVWLSSATASPWLVLERGLGLEERMSSVAEGVLSVDSFEIAATSAWLVTRDGLVEMNLATGESTTHVPLGLGGLLNRGAPGMTTSGFDECWALLLAKDGELTIFDAEKKAVLTKMPLQQSAEPFASAAGVLHASCSDNELTVVQFSIDSTDAGELRTVRFTQGAPEPTVIGSLHLSKVNRGGLAEGFVPMRVSAIAAVLLNRRMVGSTLVYETSHWFIDSTQLSPLSGVGSVLSEDGLTSVDDYSGQITLRDNRTGVNTTLVPEAPNDAATFTLVDSYSSPQGRWALLWRRQYGRTEAGYPHMPTKTVAVWRVNLKTRSVEPLSLPREMQALLPSEMSLEPSIDDDGNAHLVLRPEEGQTGLVANLVSGEVSSFDLVPGDESQMFERNGSLAFVSFVRLPDPYRFERAATVFSGSIVSPLKRRTFLSGPSGLVRRTGNTLVYVRRDPLSGLPQLFRLEL